jgi:hypothetical protein
MMAGMILQGKAEDINKYLAQSKETRLKGYHDPCHLRHARNRHGKNEVPGNTGPAHNRRCGHRKRGVKDGGVWLQYEQEAVAKVRHAIVEKVIALF